MRIASKRRAERQLEDHGFDDVRHSVDGRGRHQDVVCLGEGEPIVLVPGLAGSWNLLAPLAKRLAKKYRVVMPTLRGDRGVLGCDPAREVSDLADDLAVTLEGLGLERPTLMGVSFGGAVALEYAATRPRQVGGLALWGTEARFRPSIGMAIARRTLERFPLPSDSPFLNQFFNLLHGGRPDPSPLVDFIVDRCWRTDQSVVAHRLAMLESFDVTDRLWQIDAPTLVIAGSRDVVVPPARQRSLAGLISGSSFIEVDGAGHVGFLTHQTEILKPIETLLRRVRGSYC